MTEKHCCIDFVYNTQWLQKQKEKRLQDPGDQQQNEMIAVRPSLTVTSQETDRPKAVPRMSTQRLTEAAKEPDAAVREEKWTTVWCLSPGISISNTRHSLFQIN